VHKITNANIKEWARDYDGEPFDAILCDPPYELGFMGKSWDSSGIAFDKDMWADLFRHVKPGGHLLAFSGSRTYHRMACAIEDAGFEIRDMIEWIYGSGFPKSLNIGKAVDKIQGNEREFLGIDKSAVRTNSEKNHIDGQVGKFGLKAEGTGVVTKGTSPYEGYGTALKPAHEPCVLARKPIEGTVANNVLKYGTGGLNIDGSRVGTVEHLGRPQAKNSETNPFSKGLKSNGYNDNSQLGRFPANLIHDGSDEVVGLFPDTKSGVGAIRKTTSWKMSSVPDGRPNVEYGDSGSAARFFYTAKSSKSERNLGLEGFEVKRLEGRDVGQDERNVLYKNRNTPTANQHPTVKPLSLTKYLANLIKPPTGGRLLVPFSGSGSEMIGALQAGWEYVEGVELTEEYIPIAEARIKYWLQQKQVEESKPEQVELI